MARPELLTGVERANAKGDYNNKVVIGTGTAVLQYQVNNEGFNDVPNTSVSASTGVDIALPSCRIKAVLTGDAQVWLVKSK